MDNGYMGKFLFINLSSGEISEETPEESIYRDYIGGEGIGARILYERQKPGADPLGPENILGFVTGILTGCGIAAAARCNVVTKSPLTNGWGYANVGGSFGPELKACGYDALFIKGTSLKPVYVLLNDGAVEIKSAEHLWGMDTEATTLTLRQETGDTRIKVACIGQAGENLSLISAIISEGRAAARSGVGAVMGAKNLKAIVVRGQKKPIINSPEKMKDLQKQFLKDINDTETGFVGMIKGAGTCGGVSMMISMGGAPIKNWSLFGEEAMPTHPRLSGENITKYQQKKTGCLGCPIRCGGIVKIDEGEYAGTLTRKPEYETLIGLGTLCGNDNVESIIKANDICDRYGMDTISAGTTIAFAIECYENNLIDSSQTDGIELTWGNASAIVSMLEKMGKREGFGDVLADGVKKASEKIGQDSENYAMHVGGQELPFHDPRFMPGRGTSYISDPVPARHVQATGMLILEGGGSMGPYPETGITPPELTDFDNKGKIYAAGSNYTEVFASSGFCLFLMYVNQLPLAEFISAATGWDVTAAELLKAGQRTQTLRQAFNIREGIVPTNNHLPLRLQTPHTLGPTANTTIDFDLLRENFYQEMGWDKETGHPTQASLDDLGLKKVVGLLSKN